MKDNVLDILVGRRGYRARLPWRIASGVLAVLLVPTALAMLREEPPPHWLALLAVAYVFLLLILIAATGRLPRWLQPGRSENMERWSRQ
jgi:peptidoglycan/LPS O-acetylase OafA/YrhL